MNKVEKYSFEYGRRCIYYEVVRKEVKRVNLNIKPDMTVSVSANERVPLSFIEELIKKRAPWIIKHLNEFKQAQPDQISTKEYVSGESYRYLGKQYRLKVFEVNNIREEGVKYLRGYIHLYVKNRGDTNYKRRLLNKWYHERAKKVFNESLHRMHSKLQNYSLAYPDLKLRTMKARWGSALIESNTILLNTELIKAPKSSIEYVVLHELLHFIHNNHSKEFYELLNINMPDWKDRKELLDREVAKNI